MTTLVMWEQLALKIKAQNLIHRCGRHMVLLAVLELLYLHELLVNSQIS